VRARQSEYGFTDHAERYSQRRAVVVGGATVDFARTPTIMIIIGIVLALVARISLLAAVHPGGHAPPWFVDVTAEVATYHSIRGRSERSSSG
jgi:hypothetical protein